MESRTFTMVLIGIVTLCTLFTIAHFAYDAYAYQHCSIIYFISREIW